MKTILRFRSTGEAHEDEARFFKYLVNETFDRSKVIEWCTFDGLTVTIEAFSAEVVQWGVETLKNGVSSPNGLYKYELI
jgi:hypothetical protein